MKRSPFGFHQGAALDAIADTYPTLHKSVLEGIQNAIDAEPKFVWVNINFKNQSITIQDNGKGVTEHKFNQTLSKICSSQKSKDKLGRFGRGLVAPFGKCAYFTFTSLPSPYRQGYKTWTFDKSLLEKEVINGIPVTEEKQLYFDPSGIHGKHGVKWRSQVKIVNFTSDTQMNKITMDTLVNDVLDGFGLVMRKRKIKISIALTDINGKYQEKTFDAKDFQGIPIPEITIKNPDCGETHFRMFIARKIGNQRQGKILCGEIGDESRINFNMISISLSTRGYLEEEVIKALQSGIFEGEITSNIHLHPSRKSFYRDEGFIGFLITISEWFNEVGRSYLEDVQESSRDERYQELGLKSMSVIEDMCKYEGNCALRNAIQTFVMGSIGSGHANVSGKARIQDSPSLTTRGVPGQTRLENPDPNPPRETPSQEKKNHNPFTVSGPKGQRRKMVKSNSLGFQFRYDEMHGSRKLWVLEQESGTLAFNICHPQWTECVANENHLMRLQEFIAVQALTLFGLPEEMRDISELALESLTQPYIFIIKHADRIAGRGPGRKPVKKLMTIKAMTAKK